MGPQHPSTHGVLRIIVELDEEYIRRAEPVLGYIHRMQEKMGEVKRWQQYLPNMGRVDYLRPLSCRFFDLPPSDDNAKYLEFCHRRVEELSQGLFLALVGGFSSRKHITFPLVDVISGKFVQSFFPLLSSEAAWNGPQDKHGA